MLITLLMNALAAGFGAFAGAITAYYLAFRKDKAREIEQYLCLLLLVHEQLEPLFLEFADITEDMIFESGGAKFVKFDSPLPEFSLPVEQMQILFEVSPDKQMPSTLIQVQRFLKASSYHIKTFGAEVLPLDFVRQQAQQLQFMLLSVRTQYEQAAKVAFPLDYSERVLL